MVVSTCYFCSCCYCCYHCFICVDCIDCINWMMDEWMDGRTDGRMDGGTDRWTDGWMNRCDWKWMNRLILLYKLDGWMDEYKMDGWWMNGCFSNYIKYHFWILLAHNPSVKAAGSSCLITCSFMTTRYDIYIYLRSAWEKIERFPVSWFSNIFFQVSSP